MIPRKVLDAIHEQMKPLVMELAKYDNLPPNVYMRYDTAIVKIEFK